MLLALDPHSVYISAKDVKAVEEPLLGSFEGIGWSNYKNTINIIKL